MCLALGALLFCGCDSSHGRPAKDSETLAPDEIMDFKTLYAANPAGDTGRGEIAYKSYCEPCHGAEGRGGQKGSAITAGAFLALVSDQGLRTVVITGRPELNAPDWRGNVPGKPMAEQEVTDVVAWLASKRVQNPGQPYPAAQNNPAPGAR